MTCPPGRIQIRRDTYLAWRSLNPILAAGELGFAYPDINITESNYPNGVMKIGLNGGSSWSNSTQIYPSSGGGGGTIGPSGPSGTSSFQLVGYNGLPTITNILKQGYSITIYTASNDEVICLNPELFDISTTGITFTCKLPDTVGYSPTSIQVGFGSWYAVLSGNTIAYNNGSTQVKSSQSYTPGDTFSITYSGAGIVIFKNLTINTIDTYTYTEIQDYVYIGYHAIGASPPTSTIITYVNIYPIGSRGEQGLQGWTGPIYTVTNMIVVTVTGPQT